MEEPDCVDEIGTPPVGDSLFQPDSRLVEQLVQQALGEGFYQLAILCRQVSEPLPKPLELILPQNTYRDATVNDRHSVEDGRV